MTERDFVPDQAGKDRPPREAAAGGQGTAGALVEGVHFYWEGPFMVLMAQAHLERGYCCGNGCRHCPYGEAG